MASLGILRAVIAVLIAGAASISDASPVDGPDLKVILADAAAPHLADYRLFRDSGAQHPAEGVVAYELATPLFSDGAEKQRYVFLPSDQRARYRPDGAFEFPVGTVLIKTFALADQGLSRKLETRLLIRKRDGWRADVYVWAADGGEARLQVAGAQIPVRVSNAAGAPRAFTYAVPNRNQCKGCHSVDGALAPIGPADSHLGVSVGSAESQLQRWVRLGLVEGAPTSATRALTTLDERARAYLNVNCAHCHNPQGPANTSGLDLRTEQNDPSRWGVRKRPIAAGRGAADMSFSVDPGRPDRSILLHRMQSTDPGVMMPELGRAIVDEEGVALVRDWIAQMDADGRPRQN